MGDSDRLSQLVLAGDFEVRMLLAVALAVSRLVWLAPQLRSRFRFRLRRQVEEVPQVAEPCGEGCTTDKGATTSKGEPGCRIPSRKGKSVDGDG